ncbi:MAG: IMP cyclohydrolase [Candidatus Thermoplasmatota archaeon]|nr:IMP cyclohydrolase [Candidatus Thermoplasmatota archaeon]MDP7265982.1 IMP cyclohydrolase [Candidatus Thermoplasmatota archaeon]
MAYPGRMIIIGRNPMDTHNVIIYAITGRSPASQARKFEFKDNELLVKPTDEEELSKGDPDLLIYPAVSIKGCVGVSNGKHTLSLMEKYNVGMGPLEVLSRGLDQWTYEPDPPHFTPRISGFITPGSPKYALGILKRGKEGERVMKKFEFSMKPGGGRMIATYSGDNMNPLPSFGGEPRNCDLPFDDVRDAGRAVYRALGPIEGNDFRVALAAFFIDSNKINHYIINRCDESPTEICGFHPRKRRNLLPLLRPHQTVGVTEEDSCGGS